MADIWSEVNDLIDVTCLSGCYEMRQVFLERRMNSYEVDSDFLYYLQFLTLHRGLYHIDAFRLVLAYFLNDSFSFYNIYKRLLNSKLN